MDAGKGTQDGQRLEDQGQGSNPGVGPSQRPEGAVPETVGEGMLSQILAAIQGLAQSNVVVQGTMLEVIQRLPVPAAQGGNEAVSSASGSGSRQPARQQGSQGARDELPWGLMLSLFRHSRYLGQERMGTGISKRSS